MNPTAAAINSTVVSSTVNLTSIELVKYRVVKDLDNFWLWKSEIGIFLLLDLERMLNWQKNLYEKVLISLN